MEHMSSPQPSPGESPERAPKPRAAAQRGLPFGNAAKLPAITARGAPSTSASQQPTPPRVIEGIELRPPRPTISAAIAAEHGLSPLLSRILAARGFSTGEPLQRYLEPRLDHLEAWRLHERTDIQEAKALVVDGILRRRPFFSYSDFDCDGITSNVQWSWFLRTLGIPVRALAPNRFTHGFGPHIDLLRQMSSGIAPGVMLWSDLGTNHTEAQRACLSLGHDLLVTDHHFAESWSAQAGMRMYNPALPGQGVPGSVLPATALVHLLLREVQRALAKELPAACAINLDALLPVMLIGLVQDMTPLTGVGRILGSAALRSIEKHAPIGLRALFPYIRRPDDGGPENSRPFASADFAFGIGPRINAASRMDDGMLAFDLLMTEDHHRATQLAAAVNRLNRDRKRAQAHSARIALRQLYSEGPLPAAAVCVDDSCSVGINGLSAQEVAQHTGRPAFVLCPDRGELRVSGRNVRKVDAFDRPLFHLGKTFHHLQEAGVMAQAGGHPMAGGGRVTRAQYPAFREALIAAVARDLGSTFVPPSVLVDTEATLEEVTDRYLDELELLEPFGEGNRAPVVLFRGLTVIKVTPVIGEFFSRLELLFEGETTRMRGVLYKDREHPYLTVGARVDVAAEPERNYHSGYAELRVRTVRRLP